MGLVSDPSSMAVHYGMTWTERNTKNIFIQSRCKQARKIYEA